MLSQDPWYPDTYNIRITPADDDQLNGYDEDDDYIGAPDYIAGFLDLSDVFGYLADMPTVAHGWRSRFVCGDTDQKFWVDEFCESRQSFSTLFFGYIDAKNRQTIIYVNRKDGRKKLVIGFADD